MATYAFLSEDWFAAFRAIRAELDGTTEAPDHSVRMNVRIREVPGHDDELVDVHLDSTAGLYDFELGLLPDPDATVTLDYPTAKAIFVDANSQAGIQAFMQGTIEIDGDMEKVLQTQQPGALAAAALVERMQAVTTDS